MATSGVATASIGSTALFSPLLVIVIAGFAPNKIKAVMTSVKAMGKKRDGLAPDGNRIVIPLANGVLKNFIQDQAGGSARPGLIAAKLDHDLKRLT